MFNQLSGFRHVRIGHPKLLFRRQTWRNFFRKTYDVIEVEGVILVAMLMVTLVGTGLLWQFTDFFGNKGPYEFHMVDDD